MKTTLLAPLVVVFAGCFMAPPDGPLSAPGALMVKVQSDFRASGLECFADSICDLKRPLMTGTRELFSAFIPVRGVLNTVTVGTTPLLTAHCKDETVCTVRTGVSTCCSTGQCVEGAPADAAQTWDACLAKGGEPNFSQWFEVSALASGATSLEFVALDTPGQSVTPGPFDRLDVTVRDAARLEVQLPTRVTTATTSGETFFAASPVVLSGQHVVVRMVAFDAAGARLWATEGVKMKVETTLAQFWGDRSEVGWFGELWPMARGSTRLLLDAPSASAQVDLISQ